MNLTVPDTAHAPGDGRRFASRTRGLGPPWSFDLEAKMAAFARTFLSTSQAPGVLLWDANTLDRWAAETPVSHGELLTAQFVLAVWDPANTWRCGRFDVMEALRVWDDRHRAAFLAWARDPWWP